MSAINVPDIQNALSDSTPRTAHQLINRVENRLSTRKGSFGTDAHDAQQEHRYHISNDIDAMYTLEKRYGDEANRQFKQYCSKTG